VVTRRGFESVVNNAFAGLGFSADAAKHAFPMKMFLPGGDLSPIEKNLDAIIDGLTRWQPAEVATSAGASRLTVEASGYADAARKLNLLFLANRWSDGLPILPPTDEAVQEMLTGTDLSAETVLGKILPRGGVANIEAVAVAAAMAGCRPEYMPVLIASLEAILDPVVDHQHMQSTTGSTHPAAIVNGPVARQIRLNCGYGCLGPSSAYPAGASIGRAIRFLLMNLGGAIPGSGSMSLYGGPGRYTGLVFAEDEQNLPPDWKPLAVERGFPAGTNAVTVIATTGNTSIWEGAALSEKEALYTLFDISGVMRVPYAGYFNHAFNPKGAPGILLVGRATAEGFSNLGWSKDKVKNYLWENTTLADSDWLRKILAQFARRGMYVKDHVRFPMPIALGPENFIIVVAGGEQSGHSYWLQVHGGTFGPASKEIVLPKNWNNLLEKAEEELGPLPAS
jgi:hypothetical protein